jgi:hypothetical protein
MDVQKREWLGEVGLTIVRVQQAMIAAVALAVLASGIGWVFLGSSQAYSWFLLSVGAGNLLVGSSGLVRSRQSWLSRRTSIVLITLGLATLVMIGSDPPRPFDWRS